MNSKVSFTLYDLASYVLPGALVLVLFYWLTTGVAGVILQLNFDSLGNSIFLLGASYIVGHLIQAIGRYMERWSEQKWGGKYNERLMRVDDDYYSHDFKTSYKAAASDVFALSLPDESKPEQAAARRRELFDLSLYLVVQEKAADQYAILDANFALYRGLLPAMWFGLLVSSLVLIKHVSVLALSAIGFLSSSAASQSYFFVFDYAHLILGMILTPLFVLGVRIVSWRFETSSRRFVHMIYRNFFIWYRRQKFKQATGQQNTATGPQVPQLIDNKPDED
ncbi:MAG TPA: hypothetical protein VGE45_04855 [Chloroflexia bacterium]|jgi:hypothetical protein